VDIGQDGKYMPVNTIHNTSYRSAFIKIMITYFDATLKCILLANCSAIYL
jgi:hypothetical protein